MKTNNRKIKLLPCNKKKLKKFCQDGCVIVTTEYSFSKACDIFGLSISFCYSPDGTKWILAEGYFNALMGKRRFPIKIEIGPECGESYNKDIGDVELVFDTGKMSYPQVETLCKYLSNKLGVPYRYKPGTLGTYHESLA